MDLDWIGLSIAHEKRGDILLAMQNLHKIGAQAGGYRFLPDGNQDMIREPEATLASMATHGLVVRVDATAWQMTQAGQALLHETCTLSTPTPATSSRLEVGLEGMTYYELWQFLENNEWKLHFISRSDKYLRKRMPPCSSETDNNHF